MRGCHPQRSVGSHLTLAPLARLGDLQCSKAHVPDKASVWFGSSPAFDEVAAPASVQGCPVSADARAVPRAQEVRQKFGGDLRDAEAGRLADWRSGYPALALVILMDQLTRRVAPDRVAASAGAPIQRPCAHRNIHRGSALMYHNDAAALRLAKSLWVRRLPAPPA